MTVSTHEMTILCLIEMTEEVDSLNAIISAATKKKAEVRRSEYCSKLVDAVKTDASNGKKHLWTWNWIGGGYNQHYAYTFDEAVQRAKTMCDLAPNMSTFKLEPNEDLYWKNFPLMD